MFKKISCILLSVVLLLGMTGCSSSISDIFTDTSEPSYEESSIINLIMSDIKTLNPVVSKDADTYYISKLVYQSLFETDEHLSPSGELVSDYKVSDDGKTVTLSLVKDACFSDGSSLTADDVVFSIKCYMEAGKKSLYCDNVKGISSVSAKGKYKVAVRYKSRGEGGIKNLTFPILPSHLYSTSDLLSADSSFRPVGSGSYKVYSYKKEKKLVLVKNKKTNGTVPSNRLVFTKYSNENVLNLEEGNLLSLSLNTELERQSEVGSKSLKTTNICSNRLETAVFNCKSGIFKDKNVRQAAAYAIKKSDIITKAYYGSAVPTSSVFYPDYLGTSSKKYPYKYDTKKSEDLLNDAGIKDTDKDGIRNDEDGDNVKITIIVGSDSARKGAAQLIKKNLNSLELNAEVVSLSDKDFKKRLKKGDFDIALCGISFSDFYDVRDFLGGSSDYTGYSDTKLKNLAVTLNSCITEEKMTECVKGIDEIVTESLNYYPLCYRTYAVITSNELTGEITSLFNDIYRGCEEWKCVYEIDPEDTGE